MNKNETRPIKKTINSFDIADIIGQWVSFKNLKINLNKFNLEN